MSVSKTLKEKIAALRTEDKDRLVRMGWEDRTSFEAIQIQFDLTQNEFIRFMRSILNRTSFKRWRQRATEQGHLKHEKKSGIKIDRFKCADQSLEGHVRRKK